MPVTHVTHDMDTRTLVIVADFAAPVERVFDIYADARQLERVWGPPTYPATFAAHDLSEGGRMNYFMTGPEGERFFGYWDVQSVDSPHGFTFTDGFAVDETFAPNPDLPASHNDFRFEEHEGGTRATFTSTYESAEALQQALDMGAVEGPTEAISQIDELLAA